MSLLRKRSVAIAPIKEVVSEAPPNDVQMLDANWLEDDNPDVRTIPHPFAAFLLPTSNIFRSSFVICLLPKNPASTTKCDFFIMCSFTGLLTGYYWLTPIHLINSLIPTN
jgi:hypothetical protein